MAKVPPKVQAKARVVPYPVPEHNESEVFQPCFDDGGMDSYQSVGQDEVVWECVECLGTGSECGSSDGCCPCMCHLPMFGERQCELCVWLKERLEFVGKILRDKTMSQTAKLKRLMCFI